MLDTLIEGLFGGLLDGLFSDRRTRRRAENRQTRFDEGADVKVRCSLRRPGDSGTWVHGTLSPAADGMIWRARLNRGEPVTFRRAPLRGPARAPRSRRTAWPSPP